MPAHFAIRMASHPVRFMARALPLAVFTRWRAAHL
jgi:hypothetical protein